MKLETNDIPITLCSEHALYTSKNYLLFRFVRLFYLFPPPFFLSPTPLFYLKDFIV